ncbi:MAG: GNAT family N-acetyltransferase [Bacteroidales bacterium]
MKKTDNTKFTLRPFRESDAESIAKYANNPNIAKNLTDAFPNPYGLEDAIRFLSMAIQNEEPYTLFAIEINGEACGSIGIFIQSDIHRKSAECGYWLAEPYWGQGIIPEAIKQIVDYSFHTFDIVRIYARPFSFNKKSQRVLEKAVFSHEATLKKACFKNGEFCDEMIYSIIK